MVVVPAITSFWATLPDNAGMYREVLTIPWSRTQFATNKKEPVVGMGSLSSRPYVSVLDKSGYWGVIGIGFLRWRMGIRSTRH